MPPETTVWPLDEHTKAKHQLLSLYLDAWVPIMGRHNEAIALIDGYAGPGIYEGGEPGSPILMLEAYLDRPDRDQLKAQPRFMFVEKDGDRFAVLEQELAKVPRPANVQCEAACESFDEVLDSLLDQAEGRRTIPIFLFVDPFGYSYDVDLISRLMAHPRCDTLIFLPTPWIARHLTQPQLERTITRALGSEDWKPAREMDALADREVLVCQVFEATLRRAVEYVLAFHVETTATSSYDLFFGTNHPMGVDAMKNAMWKVDETGAYKWRTGNAHGQTVMFSGEPDTAEAEAALRAAFGGREFTIEEAVDAWVRTRFRDTHLRQWALKPLERQPGRLEVRRPPGKRPIAGQYPVQTRLRLLG